MDLLSLTLIGWLYSIACGVALGLGVWLTIGLHYSGEDARKQLAARALDDSLLFGIWIMGLAGGVGVLLEKSWSRWVLELFCWVLIVLVGMSSFSRWRAATSFRIGSTCCATASGEKSSMCRNSSSTPRRLSSFARRFGTRNASRVS